MTSLTADPARRKQLRLRSKQLFGNADRLEVAAAVARSSSGVVNAKELAEALKIDAPRVRAQLLAFVEAELMEIMPRQSQTVQYARVADPFWTGIVAMIEGWEVAS